MGEETTSGVGRRDLSTQTTLTFSWQQAPQPCVHSRNPIGLVPVGTKSISAPSMQPEWTPLHECLRTTQHSLPESALNLTETSSMCGGGDGSQAAIADSEANAESDHTKRVDRLARAHTIESMLEHTWRSLTAHVLA